MGAFKLQAMLQYNREAKEVQLAVDRDYQKGEPIKAWCGPQVRHSSLNIFVILSHQASSGL